MGLLHCSTIFLVLIAANILPMESGSETGPDSPKETVSEDKKETASGGTNESAPDSAKGTGTDSSKKALKKECLDAWIGNYLKVFEIVKKTVNEEEHLIMDIIEKLVIQCWIRTLNPDLALIKDFVFLEDSTSSEAVEQKLIKSLQDLRKTTVEDAVLDYGSDVSEKIKLKIAEEAKKCGFDEKMINHIYTVHNWMCNRMFMQSFIFNFVEEPYGNCYEFKFNEGESVKVDITKIIVTDWTVFYTQ